MIYNIDNEIMTTVAKVWGKGSRENFTPVAEQKRHLATLFGPLVLGAPQRINPHAPRRTFGNPLD